MTVSTKSTLYLLKYASHCLVRRVDELLRVFQRDSVRAGTAHDAGDLLCALLLR